ncbi:MAG: dihydrolipoamide acetyltransferase family protein [Actinomycetota bacterium]|jgi:pyruvate dehydrogenase E2 component (dihydrolipoamide acetyltransferase)|nr:dihydrolipoamide acetyltransferase family protein [Actinomycetota bacterium]
MERDFLLPDVGEGLENATIVEWHVAEGAAIELNQPLVTIETAKAAVELPSPFAGRVTHLNAAPGDELAVGALLARIDTGEGADAGAAPITSASGAGTPPSGAGPGATRPQAGQPSRGADQAAGRDGTHERASGREALLVGYGAEPPQPARRPRDWSRTMRMEGVPTSASEPPAPASPPSAARPMAKPPVRWLAKSLGVDLRSLQATGPHGEVSRDDVEAAASARAGVETPDWREEPRQGETFVGRAPAEQLGEELPDEIPVVGIRARIAERMSRSRAQIPEATAGLWVDCERLLEMRALLDDELERANPARAGGDRHDDHHHPRQELTPFALLAWMVPIALRAAPLLNASFDSESKMIHVHRSVHLGIATSTQHGLVVPVLREADRLTVGEFAAELARLSRSARAGTLTPNELVGSTFTISNYGALGLDDGNPVINIPEAAILGVGSIAPRAAVHDDALEVRATAKLVCAFDHRVCDGAEAARFLLRLKALVERPERALAAR